MRWRMSAKGSGSGAFDGRKALVSASLSKDARG